MGPNPYMSFHADDSTAPLSKLWCNIQARQKAVKYLAIFSSRDNFYTTALSFDSTDQMW
jgi:hypothetical protein